MKQEFFNVIPQNMREYKMSIREASNENDLFHMAFDEAMKGHAYDLNSKDDVDRYMAAWDSFKDGWEAAVRLLNDDANRAPVSAPTAGERQSIDTPEFRELLEAYSNWHSRIRREKLIAHIDTWASRSADDAVPAGFKLVPLEPTDDMFVAFAETWFSKVRPIDDCGMEDCYAAMLVAAPAPGNTEKPEL